MGKFITLLKDKFDKLPQSSIKSVVVFIAIA